MLRAAAVAAAAAAAAALECRFVVCVWCVACYAALCVHIGAYISMLSLRASPPTTPSKVSVSVSSSSSLSTVSGDRWWRWLKGWVARGQRRTTFGAGNSLKLARLMRSKCMTLDIKGCTHIIEMQSLSIGGFIINCKLHV